MTQSSEKVVRDGLPEVMPRLWRYAMVLSRRKDVADDLVQATAIRALEKSHQFQVGTKLDSWLFTILSSIWKNKLRSDKVRRGEGLQPVEEVEIASNDLDTETSMLAKEVVSLVMDLPSAQKDAVFLVYVEGYAYKEAAAMLDIPIGTVMSRLAAGRKKINEVMRERDAALESA